MIIERITVLGAGGFLGSHLVPALLARFGCQIDAVDVDFSKLEHRDPRLERIRAHIESPGLLQDLVARSQLVVSLTALCNPALYNREPLRVIDANYTHLLPVVESCAQHGVRLLHFSTSEVYGKLALDPDGTRSRTMNEDTTSLVLGPVECERWTYACAKQLLERVIWAHGAHGQLDFTIVRLFNVIGPRMDFLPGVDGEGIPRVLPMFMNALLRGQELQLVDGGQQRRSFMAVEDLVEAVCRIVERPEPCRKQILNLGNPQNDVSIEGLARQLAEVFAVLAPKAPPARMCGTTAARFYGPGYDDSEARIPDIDKTVRLLDWRPEISLAQMLPGIVGSYIERYGSRLASAARDMHAHSAPGATP